MLQQQVPVHQTLSGSNDSVRSSVTNYMYMLSHHNITESCIKDSAFGNLNVFHGHYIRLIMEVVNTNTIHINMSVQEDASASYMTVRHTAEADIYSNRYLLK